MPGLLFWDVDTQHDFMKADGALYVPGAETIIPALRALRDHATAHGIRVVASADDHVPGHRELSDTPDFTDTFPPHCMRGTPGQRRIPETALVDPLVIEPEPQDPAALAARLRAHRGDVLLHKHWFPVGTNANLRTVLDTLAPDTIVVYGVATDYCVRYAIEALRAHRPQARLCLVRDAVKAIHADAEPALLAGWEREGVALVTASDVLAGRLPAPVA